VSEASQVQEASTPTDAAASPVEAQAPAPAPAAEASANQQPDAQQAPADAAPGDKPAADAVPEKYEFKAPEGVAFDAELLGEFEGLARDLKLAQDGAQKVADLGAKMAQKFAAQQAEVVQQARQEWTEQRKADKELGGAQHAEKLAVAEKALAAFGTPELRALLVDSGLGDHPEVIRAFFKVGQAISEDRMVTGDAGPRVSDARSIYSASNMNP
jgi:hypothetical protein